jgi:hypothetical protein
MESTKEQEVLQKIKYADWIARIMIAASVIFIGYGASVKLLQDAAYGNTIMLSGLVFVALFGVAVYVKKKLETSIEAGKTFHG